MLLWRIARTVYEPLDGEGARLHGGRWNSPGIPVIYTAEHLSLAIIETLVHTDPDLVPDDLAIFEIETTDPVSCKSVDISDLPADWTDVPDHPACRAIGDEWVHDGECLMLAVPSAVVPEERNYLLNPVHPQMRSVSVARSRPFVFDPRLL